MPDAPPAPIHALRGLAVLAEPPTDEHGPIAEALGLPAAPTPAEYSDLFLFQLYPYASVYLGPEGMLGGIARDRIAGFWRAVGLTPPAEPDHLAALLGLYVSLIERAEAPGRTVGRGSAPPASSALGMEGRSQSAREELEGRPERAGSVLEGRPETARGVLETRAARVLLDEHLTPWIFAWIGRLGELGHGVYRAWGSLLETVLREELRRPTLGREPGVGALEAPDAPRLDSVDGSRLQHLRDAPPLPDPRADGMVDFIGGLLAPVRSGVILTRADLAAVARACDLGLRAGERRYALEHLLAQDARATLRALWAEADRQAEAHRRRVDWLGESASWMAGRAQATAARCHELSDHASS